MNASQLISLLAGCGITIRVDEQDLEISAPEGALTESLIGEIKACKSEGGPTQTIALEASSPKRYPRAAASRSTLPPLVVVTCWAPR